MTEPKPYSVPADDSALVLPDLSFLRTNPVVAAGLALFAPIVASFVEALLAGADLRAALSAATAVALVVGVAVVRTIVTPVADPKVAEDVPLTPEAAEPRIVNAEVVNVTVARDDEEPSVTGPFDAAEFSTDTESL